MKHFDLSQISDPNALGELFRAHSFVTKEGEVGCYSAFELHPQFKPIKDPELLGLVRFNMPLEDGENFEAFQDFQGLVLAWHWEGDGTLLFLFDGIAVINTDCKKNYGWEFTD